MGPNKDQSRVPRASIPLSPAFNWSVGNWMEQFFDGMKEGKILASRCPACGRVYLPPRMICERCFVKAEEWVELPETGTVETFTEAYVKLSESGKLEDLEKPEIIAMIKHDGADTCVAGRVEAGSVTVGMRVKAVLDPSASNVLDLLSGYRAAE